MFVTFEGIEGCGKSTQAGMLRDAAVRTGRDVVHTRDPGGTPVAEMVRNLLLEGGAIGEMTELLLFEASRSELVRAVIAPALARGALVICDRFCDSTVAYQGFGRGLDTAVIDKLNRLATGGITPRRTYFLDLPPDAMAARISHKRKDRIELEDHGFHLRVCEGFRTIARSEPGRIVTIDASMPADEIHGIIMADLARIHEARR